jgi:hypothetical protein
MGAVRCLIESSQAQTQGGRAITKQPKRKPLRKAAAFIVVDKGFEPLTSSMSRKRANQLR